MIDDCKELLSALVKAQLEMPIPEKDKTNNNFKYKYASLDSIYKACREPLAKNGLILTHTIMRDEQNNLTLLTKLQHTSGQKIFNEFPIFLEKVTSQGMGSARTYACRYAIASLLALPSDEDDDGEIAESYKINSYQKKAAPEQSSYTEFQNLKLMLEAEGLNTSRLSEWVSYTAKLTDRTDLMILQSCLTSRGFDKCKTAFSKFITIEEQGTA